MLNLLGAALPDGKPLAPHANSLIYLEILKKKKKQFISFHIWNVLLKKTFTKGPQKACFFLGRRMPMLAWAQYALLAYHGKENEPRKAWATTSILAPIPGSHVKLMHHCWIFTSTCLLASTTGSGFALSLPHSRHKELIQASEPWHLAPAPANKLQESMQLSREPCKIDVVKGTQIMQDEIFFFFYRDLHHISVFW